jgi:hypothetical protein
MTSIQRSREAEAFLEARLCTAPDIVSACDGWTAHEITAHLTAMMVEVTHHLEPYARGDEVPKTLTFEQREPPFRAMDDGDLCKLLSDEEHRMRAAIEQVLAREPDAVIRWTGRNMEVAKFVLHVRNEFAIHRWDFVGDDEISKELLCQPELIEHSVGVLGRILLARGVEHDPFPGQEFHVSLRAEGSPNVRLVVEADLAGLVLDEREIDEPHVDFDAAARTLVIWGRRPDQRGRFRSTLGEPVLRRLQALLSGY